MEDGIAELGMARAGDLTELLRDGVPLAEDEAGEDGLMELLVKRELAGKKAAIEGGEREFKIVGIETAGFFDGAGAGAGAKADVPHALDNGSYSFLGLLFCFLVGEGEEHIDVGVGEEVLASVAAQGKEGDVLGGLSSEGPTPHFNEDAVDYGGASADGSGAVPRALTGLADKRHLPKILIP
jgi:hypothetical protein